MKKSMAIVACLLVAAGLSWPTEAGNLEPPGPPAPTMKTLDEAEPRIPIDAADLPLLISSSGSYYLAEDISTTGNGINIDADDVTLDLSGFTLEGGTGDGIKIQPGRTSVWVLNGVIRGWSSSGVDAFNATAIRYSDLRVFDNGFLGLRTGADGIVTDCIAQSNLNSGIIVGVASIVSRCNASHNGSGAFGVGIQAESGSWIIDCVARLNVAAGIDGNGSCNIFRCASVANGTGITAGPGAAIVEDSYAASNDDDGIRGSGGALIRGCKSSGNDGDGIEIDTLCVVAENLSVGNGPFGADGAGIHVTGGDNRIEDNQVTSNDRGIDVDAAGNLIVKNGAAGNTSDYDIVGGNDVGPIGSAATATSPWANLQF